MTQKHINITNKVDLTPIKIKTFYDQNKTAVLVEQSTVIDGTERALTIHFFDDSKIVLAKGLTLTIGNIAMSKDLKFPVNKFYVLTADNMTDDDIMNILESSEHAQIDWFNKQKEIGDVLLLNDLI